MSSTLYIRRQAVSGQGCWWPARSWGGIAHRKRAICADAARGAPEDVHAMVASRWLRTPSAAVHAITDVVNAAHHMQPGSSQRRESGEQACQASSPAQAAVLAPRAARREGRPAAQWPRPRVDASTSHIICTHDTRPWTTGAFGALSASHVVSFTPGPSSLCDARCSSGEAHFSLTISQRAD